MTRGGGSFAAVDVPSGRGAPGAANDQADQTASVPVIVKQEDGVGQAVMPDPAVETAIKRAMEDAENETDGESSDEEAERPAAEVVELDAFRKK